MKVANGRLVSYVFDLSGTKVEKGIFNPHSGVYGKSKTVFLPESNDLKKLGVDYFELSHFPEEPAQTYKHLAMGKIIEEVDENGEVQTYRKVLAEGSGKQGFKAVRDFIKMIREHNTKVS